MNELVEFCWRGCAGRKITITNQGARWPKEETNLRTSKIISFSKEQFKAAISFLLANCQFTIGNKIFRQIIGIPMGSDPAPFMANLFLYFYENKYLKELKKIDTSKARRFGNVFRYIDDLCAINDGGQFENSYKDIYPPELELKKENIEYHNASFLDLDINIIDKRFQLKLYDKRDAFPFSIVRMPFLSNNMPTRIFYSTIGSEILRIAKCTTEYTHFVNTCSKLMIRMSNQGANYYRTKNTINRIFDKHRNTFTPFHQNSNDLFHAIFPNKH